MIRLLASVVLSLACISCSSSINGIEEQETSSKAFLVSNKTDTINAEMSYVGGRVIAFQFNGSNMVITANQEIGIGLYTVDIEYKGVNNSKGNLLVNDTVNGLSGAIQNYKNGEYSVVEFKNVR